MRVHGQSYRTIFVADDGCTVAVIDQTRLPFAFELRHLQTAEDAAEAIREKIVRGAPLIGVTAAYGVALGMRDDPGDASLGRVVDMLAAMRPTAVNLRWAPERMRGVLSVEPPSRRVERAYEEALISALHKSMRKSDADATLFWLARMLEAGDDPLYVARRIVRFASEDVGLADPRALTLALAAKDAVHFVGRPEADLALAEAAAYCALAPKSNALYVAWGEIRAAIKEGATDPVPLAIRNAVNGLMKAEGYGRGYEYAHDADDGVTAMDWLPERVRGRRFYRPTARGLEARNLWQISC